MAKEVKSLIQVAPQFQVKRGAVKTESGLHTRYLAAAIYDTAVNDSAGVSNKTIAAHGLGVYIPLGAIITKVFYQVKTTFTSATNAGTVALRAQTANDLFSALAVSDAKWAGAAITAGVPDGTVANMISLTAEREIIATVAVEALTAGKAIVFVEYIMGL